MALKAPARHDASSLDASRAGLARGTWSCADVESGGVSRDFDEVDRVVAESGGCRELRGRRQDRAFSCRPELRCGHGFGRVGLELRWSGRLAAVPTGVTLRGSRRTSTCTPGPSLTAEIGPRRCRPLVSARTPPRGCAYRTLLRGRHLAENDSELTDLRDAATRLQERDRADLAGM
jgi:hypothetical protein